MPNIYLMKGALQVMKSGFKRVAALTTALFLIICTAGCSNADETPNSYTAYKAVSGGSGSVASNDNYNLLWDNNSKCVLLNDYNSGKVWSSIPYDYYKQEETDGVAKVQLRSPIMLEYYETSSLQIKSATGYAESVAPGTVIAQKIKNGVKVTYYFERLKISVPIKYLLLDNGVEVRLMVDDIGEDNNLVTKVSVLPYFASTTPGDSSYLVVPSGSGALMYTDVGKRNVRTFSGDVYGSDFNSNENEKISNKESVRLPFFGVKSANDAMCVILDKGAETASINARSGDNDLGYASAYVTYQLRSFDYVQTQSMHGMTNVVSQYSYKRLSIDYCSVKYIPINGKNAGYMEIASKYRDYMVNKTDKKKGNSEPGLYLKIYGAAETKKLVLGVPTTKLTPLTTLEDAEKIIDELAQKTGAKLSVQLMGYGLSGLNTGKIAGGFKLSSVTGTLSEFRNLSKKMRDSKIGFFTDFDLVKYSSSGNGISLYSDSVRTPNGLALTKYNYMDNIFNKDESTAFKLLGRDNIDSVTNSLLKTADHYEMSGISLQSLSSVAYSDFSNTDYFIKSGMGKQVRDIVKQLKNKKIGFASDNANAYAAEVSDCIFDAPDSSNRSNAFDVELPLYQIVYKGYVPMSGATINLAEDANTAFLKAVSTGTGLCFSVVNNRDRELIDEKYNNAVSFCDYDSWKDKIVSMTDNYSKLIKKLEGCTISGYHIISDNVRETEFSNGVKVTVNFGDTDMQTENGTVKAGNYLVSGVMQ